VETLTLLSTISRRGTTVTSAVPHTATMTLIESASSTEVAAGAGITTAPTPGAGFGGSGRGGGGSDSSTAGGRGKGRPLRGEEQVSGQGQVPGMEGESEELRKSYGC